MNLLSRAFLNNNKIPQKYTSLGANINPPLSIKNIPSNAKSLVLIIEDIDAYSLPWVHWLVFNIPVSSNEIQEGSVPEGATQALSNNKTFAFEGPSPKYFSGIHHYLFRIYALDTILNISENSLKEQVIKSMKGHILQTADLIGIREGIKEKKP